MSTVRKNKITVPLNSDAWNLVPDLTTMADTTNVPIKVASAAERDALASPQNGDKVIRTDLAGQPFETYDSASTSWQPQVTSAAALSPTGYSVTGTFYKISFGAFNLITATLTIVRTGSSVVANGGGVSYVSTGVITPTTMLSATSSQYIAWNGFTSGSGTAEEFQFLFNTTGGALQFRGSDGGGTTNTWITNGQTNFSVTYIQVL